MRRPRRRLLLRGSALAALSSVVLYFGTAWLGGCASPIEGVWPPAPGEETYAILVSADSWHSVVGVWPEDDPGGDAIAGLEEWGYAEKGYYYEGDAGCSGTVRALFVPSTGALQATRGGPPWSERTPQPPARSWRFRLSERGYRKLLEFVDGEKESARPFHVGRSTWYEASKSYHVFHHCHHWTARALRSAGLPVWSFYALFQSGLEAQLDRAKGFVEESEE